jgi:hypothetical protein
LFASDPLGADAEATAQICGLTKAALKPVRIPQVSPPKWTGLSFAKETAVKLVCPLALMLSASCALAQAEPRPFFYLWAQPLGAGANFTTYAAQIAVDPFADYDDAETNAATTKAAVDAIVANGYANPQHICIYLRNFGQGSNGVSSPIHPSSFFDAGDAPSVDWVNNPPETPDMNYMNPWLTIGIPKVRTWMQHFVAEYKRLGGLPPARFSFGAEIYLSGTCCYTDYVRLLEGIANDPRWADPAYPVPGFGGATMNDLYLEACDRYSWGTPPYPTLAARLFPYRSLPPNDDHNRPYILWYTRLCEQVADAAMQEAVYSVIQDPVNWPACKVSNYLHFNANGDEDEFGWYTLINAAGGGVSATRTSVRGDPDGFGWGTYNYIGDLYDRYTHGNSRWLVLPSVASGNFSAPGLYPFPPNLYAGLPYRNYYQSTYMNPDRNVLTPADANLFLNRRTTESVLNTTGTTETFAPWVKAIDDTDHPTAGELVNQLAMLRAKQVKEMRLWWDDGNPNHPFQSWPRLLNVMDEVYQPQLETYALSSGTPESTMDLDRVRYTLRGPAETFDCQSGVVNGLQTIVLVGLFDNVVGSDGHAILQTNLNLECSVTDNTVRGSAWVWNPAFNTWLAADARDFDPDPNVTCAKCQFGFFAPPTPPDNTHYEMRRTFPIPTVQSGAPTHQMIVRVVLQKPVAGDSFHASFDLFQLVGTGELGSTADTTIAQGADYDYSGTVTTSDATAFMSDWANHAPLADFNNDGVIDANDLIAFLAAFDH